jgi:hypothetical protein
VIFGYKLPGLLPPSIQAVNTELGVYSTIINDVLVVSGALLGFYSLVAVEVVKTTVRYVAETKRRYTLLTRLQTARLIVNVFLVVLLIVSIYAILLISMVDASHAAVYQGYVSNVACQIATTLQQANMASHNITYGEIDCQGIPTPLYVSSPSSTLNQSLSVQLQDETGSITRYEQLLFSDVKNAGNMLEAAILLLSLLIVTYALTLSFKNDQEFT